MKKILYIMISVILAAASSAGLYAQHQNLRTAYFLDGYTYRYKFNPAFAPERGFVSFPVLGNMSLGVESNLGASNFYFPTSDGKLAFFLNDSVSDEQFMSGLNERNMLNANINLNVLAFGFRTGKSYHTVDLSLKVNERSNLPKSLFAFAKVGTAGGNTSWTINNLGIRTDSYIELAYGYSRSIGDALRVGGRVKLLTGLVREDLIIDRIDLQMSSDSWKATALGHADFSGPIDIATQQGTNLVDFENISMPDDYNEILNSYKNNKSFGFALDLGASYDFLDYFTASFSILDIGFLSWKNTTSAIAPGNSWYFDGFGTINTDGSTDFGSEFEEFGKELAEMAQLEVTGKGLKKSVGLSATIHAGIEARMPFYKRLTFGLLATQHIDGPFSWTEGRLSANIAPINCISLAASYALSNFGSSLGGVVNFHFPGFNLYMGLDSFSPLLNMTTNYIPVKSVNTNLAFGLNITFGKPHGIYHDMKRAKKAAKAAAKAE